MKEGMQNHQEEAKHAVAIRYDAFPSGRRPPDQIRSGGVSMEQWTWMVHRALTAKDIHCRLIMDNTEEGKAILNGTDLSNITSEFLMGLDPVDEDTKLREMAKRFGLTIKPGTKKKVIVLRILAAKEEGTKPSEPVGAI
jgi:hypothetical protein